MTKEELAQKLNGREYCREITREELEDAKRNNLVVVYGASDDLMEFRGAIEDEIDAYEGATVSIDKNGLLQNQCENDRCPYFSDRTAKAAKIEAVWCPQGEDLSWAYKTEIPHATFDVLEDGELYCRGIVFRLDDLHSKER
jgi:hypothetical protein